jgi:hypothetical protein
MNPDENAISIQTGTLSQLPKGDLLSWKRWKSTLFQNFIVICMLAVLIYLTNGLHFKYIGAIFVVIYFLSSSMNSIGIEELKDRGYRKLIRFYFVGILFGLIGIILLCITKIIQVSIVNILVGIFLVFCFTPFPLALYLNSKQKKSSTESTIADAN